MGTETVKLLQANAKFLLCFKLHVKCMTPGTLASAISSSGSSTSASSVLVEDKCFKRKHYYGSASKEPI